MRKEFFSEDGISSTSANFIANMAKEQMQTIKSTLNNVTFLNVTVQLLGDTPTSVRAGAKEVSTISQKLDTLAKYTALIAWLREALKAKEQLLNNARTDLYKTTLEAPKMEPLLTKDDIIFSIKDLNRYYALNAKVATLGSYIHPEGHFSKSRAELKERSTNPISYKENGRDTLIYKYAPSISLSSVDETFNSLQTEWRNAQAELNAYEHKIQTILDNDAEEKRSRYRVALNAYNAKYKEEEAAFEQNRLKTIKEISNLKIAIPNDLRPVYESIRALLKK